jgi:hypothetical protein
MFSDEIINEIVCSLNKLKEKIDCENELKEKDFNLINLDFHRFEIIDEKFTEIKKTFYNKMKIDLIKNYKKQPINFFHDFVNDINGKKFNLIDRLKPEIYKAVFEEKQVWFDAVYIYKGKFHSSILYKINFFTSEVKKDKNNKIMELSPKDNYYLNVTVDGTLFYHHQVVAATFLTGYQPKYYVDHIDGNHVNNNVTNLRWASSSENGYNKHKNNKHKNKH